MWARWSPGEGAPVGDGNMGCSGRTQPCGGEWLGACAHVCQEGARRGARAEDGEHWVTCVCEPTSSQARAGGESSPGGRSREVGGWGAGEEEGP